MNKLEFISGILLFAFRLACGVFGRQREPSIVGQRNFVKKTKVWGGEGGGGTQINPDIDGLYEKMRL